MNNKTGISVKTDGKASRANSRPATVTLEDVARVAGVSTASVSRMMRKPSSVSEKMRVKIEKAINSLGWVPHAAARALATNKTRTIGAVFPTLANEHFSQATQVIQEELEKHDYTLLLACSQYDLQRELRQTRKMLERGVDALVLVGDTHDPALYPLLEQRQIPFVSTFTWREGSEPYCIGSDNQQAFYDVVRYLIELGHQRFGMLAQSTEGNDRAAARLLGVKNALEEEGLAIRPAHYVEGYWGVEEGRALFRELVSTEPKPTAVICGHGTFAMGAMLEALAMGIRIPEEMTLFGFDDFELMKELPVPLSTIYIPSAEIGRKATQYLMAQLGEIELDVDWDTYSRCEAEMIIRSSSGKPHKD